MSDEYLQLYNQKINGLHKYRRRKGSYGYPVEKNTHRCHPKLLWNHEQSFRILLRIV
jgi:hypothetical protein